MYRLVRGLRSGFGDRPTDTRLHLFSARSVQYGFGGELAIVCTNCQFGRSSESIQLMRLLMSDSDRGLVVFPPFCLYSQGEASRGSLWGLAGQHGRLELRRD